jgi:hypothetical protein
MVRRYLELHRERLEEHLGEPRRTLGRFEQVLTPRSIQATARLLEKRGRVMKPVLDLSTARQGVKEGPRTRKESAMAIQDVTVVSVPVSDQERAKAFYVETLGSTSSSTFPLPTFAGSRSLPRGPAPRSPGGLVRFDAAGSLNGLVLMSSDLRAAKQVTQPIRNREAPVTEPPLV